VKEAFDKNTGKKVIVKFINKTTVQSTQAGLPEEINILLEVSHPSIVEVMEVFESEDYFIFVMEKFGQGTDLFDFLQDHDNLTEPQARYVFRQILSAVAHLASLHVIHGDIKVRSFLPKKWKITRETQS